MLGIDDANDRYVITIYHQVGINYFIWLRRINAKKSHNGLSN